jgi:hypothetical protein
MIYSRHEKIASHYNFRNPYQNRKGILIRDFIYFKEIKYVESWIVMVDHKLVGISL